MTSGSLQPPNFDASSTTHMRNLVLPASLLVTVLATAQVDINKLMQQPAGGQGPGNGVRMEDDTDPFVPNEFIGSFRMEMHRYKGTVEEKASPLQMRYWSSADKTLNQMEMPEQRQRMKTLTDLQGKWTYTLMTDEQGTKRAMKSRKKKFVLAEPAGERKEPSIVTTKETRTIEGHTCTKVIVTTTEGSWTGWVAPDVKAPFADMTRNVQQRGNESTLRAMRAVQGMPLEFEWVPTDGSSRLVSYIKELVVGKVDPAVFSLDGYSVMEIPNFGQ